MSGTLRPRSILFRNRIQEIPGEEVFVLAADGAVPIDADRTFLITKGSAAALTVAAPGQANIGRRLIVTGGTDFAHVITFTGSTLRDGTTGASVTVTYPAFRGATLEVIAVDATTWNVKGNNLTVIT